MLINVFNLTMIDAYTHCFVSPGNVKVKLEWLQYKQSLACVVQLPTDEEPRLQDVRRGRGRWDEGEGLHHKLCNSISCSGSMRIIYVHIILRTTR